MRLYVCNSILAMCYVVPWPQEPQTLCVPITLCGSYSCNEMHWNCPCVWVLISMPVVLPWQHLCILMEWSVSERLGSAPHLHSWHRKLVAWAGMLHDPATYSAASIGSWLHGLRCCTSQLRTVQLAVVLSEAFSVTGRESRHS